MFVHRETVRFRDLDPMGHVNNAVYLTWIENARIEFLRSLGAFDSPYTGEMTMILARAEVDFRSPLGFGDEVEIDVRPVRLGTKSFDLAYELRSGERLVAEARTVLVTYDYGRAVPIEVPPAWRERLAARTGPDGTPLAAPAPAQAVSSGAAATAAPQESVEA
jgi:acyl-CoA thioester hydrolase